MVFICQFPEEIFYSKESLVTGEKTLYTQTFNFSYIIWIPIFLFTKFYETTFLFFGNLVSSPKVKSTKSF